VNVVVLAGLYLSSLVSYVLFHSLIELVTVAVASCVFILTWNTRQYFKNGFLKVLGIGYAFWRGDRPDSHAFLQGSRNLPRPWVQLEPGGAAVDCRALSSDFLPDRGLGVEGSRGQFLGGLVVFAAGAALLLLAIFNDSFPDCFVEGKGLTAFKVKIE